MKRFYLAVGLACLLAGRLWAADDPFCGKWKLNMGKSKFSANDPRLRILAAISTNGPAARCRTRSLPMARISQSISAEPFDRSTGTNEWKMVIKQDGKVLSSMMHTLSDNGKMQTIKGTSTKPDGTTSDFNVQLKKVSGGSGWAGTGRARK